MALRQPALHLVLLGLLTAWSGCTTPPVAAPQAERALLLAEAGLQAGQWDDVDEALAPLAEDACPRRLRDRRDVARARAHLGRGDLWDAYLVLEPFPDDHPHSDLRPQVAEMVWEIGNALAASDGGFLFFWSDRRAGRTVLEHLITRHPDSQHNGDALRILGDMAFVDENYTLAQQRFQDLMLNHPDSEWFVHAQYRFAMSVVASLEGPDYDLDRMQHASRELRNFLATRPENPAVAQDAERALVRITEWRADRHLRIARFYRRVGNDMGYRHHVTIAAGPEFVATPFHQEAREALAELDTTAQTSPGATP